MAIDHEITEYEPRHDNYTSGFWSLVYCASDIVMFKSPGRSFWQGCGFGVPIASFGLCGGLSDVSGTY